MVDVTRISPPTRAATDLMYEAELKATLDPAVAELLDTAETAGWDRRKAAYAVMVLAARNLSEQKANSGNGAAIELGTDRAPRARP
jgi:hypothetical protein